MDAGRREDSAEKLPRNPWELRYLALPNVAISLGTPTAMVKMSAKIAVPTTREVQQATERVGSFMSPTFNSMRGHM